MSVCRVKIKKKNEIGCAEESEKEKGRNSIICNNTYTQDIIIYLCLLDMNNGTLTMFLH